MEHQFQLIILPSLFLPPPTRFFSTLFPTRRNTIVHNAIFVVKDRRLRTVFPRTVCPHRYIIPAARSTCAHTRLGGWKATRHENSTDLDRPREMGSHTSGSSQRVKRLLSLSNSDLRCSFQAYDDEHGMAAWLDGSRAQREGGRSFPGDILTGEKESSRP